MGLGIAVKIFTPKSYHRRVSLFLDLIECCRTLPTRPQDGKYARPFERRSSDRARIVFFWVLVPPFPEGPRTLLALSLIPPD